MPIEYLQIYKKIKYPPNIGDNRRQRTPELEKIAILTQFLSENMWSESSSRDLPIIPLYPHAEISMFLFIESELDSILYRMIYIDRPRDPIKSR